MGKILQIYEFELPIFLHYFLLGSSFLKCFFIQFVHLNIKKINLTVFLIYWAAYDNECYVSLNELIVKVNTVAPG